MLRIVAGILAALAVIAVAWILLNRPEIDQAELPDEKALSDAASPGASDMPAPSAEAVSPPAAAAPAGNADQKNAATGGEAPAPAPGTDGSPLETARNAEKGSLKSPYADYAEVAEEGRKKYMAAGCNGCHGGTGGGGMGPPLTNPVWVYGKDDDTLFRLIALGSDELQKQGYSRKGSENVVGPKPPMGGIDKSDDDMWKIIAFIRSVNPSSAENSAASAE
jgi:mono/diheme cytochrome c family protein